MDTPRQVLPDIHILPAHFPIPGAGFLPVNAFVVMGAEPILIDTGMGIDRDAFMEALASVLDPRDLRWVWLTHDDADHTGNIQQVLEAAPRARLVTNCLSALRMSTAWPVPMPRVYWLNPGESIMVGDCELTAIRPPLFDNPTTIGIYDHKSEVFFSADCFGAIIPSPAEHAADVPEEMLAQGMISWASGDNPWVRLLAPDVLGRELDSVRRLAPKMILSSHLPPVQGKTEQLLEWLLKVPTAPPFVAPNQAALEEILAQADVVG